MMWARPGSSGFGRTKTLTPDGAAFTYVLLASNFVAAFQSGKSSPRTIVVKRLNGCHSSSWETYAFLFQETDPPARALYSSSVVSPTIVLFEREIAPQFQTLTKPAKELPWTVRCLLAASDPSRTEVKWKGRAWA